MKFFDEIILTSLKNGDYNYLCFKPKYQPPVSCTRQRYYRIGKSVLFGGKGFKLISTTQLHTDYKSLPFDFNSNKDWVVLTCYLSYTQPTTELYSFALWVALTCSLTYTQTKTELYSPALWFILKQRLSCTHLNFDLYSTFLYIKPHQVSPGVISLICVIVC